MAIFVMAPKVGMEALEAVFKRPLGMTFFKHRSWMWYTALKHSEMESHWYEFAYFHNEGVDMCRMLRSLRAITTPEQWLLLGRRLGVSVFKGTEYLNPYWYSQKGTTKAVWTKGGTWDRRNNFTKVIVLGENITGRDHNHSVLTRKLKPHHCRQIEKEIFNLVDPDELLYPDAIDKAIEHVRWRLPNIVGRRHRLGYNMVAWFFQTNVPHPKGGYISPKQTVRYPRKYRKHKRNVDWRWLP